MEPGTPDSLRQRRRRSRHVSFGHLENEPYDVPHRRYPPTPTRLSPTFYGKYAHWKRDLGFFLVSICMIFGLSADYTLARENDTPVICYLGSWPSLHKCPTTASEGFAWRYGSWDRGANFHIPEPINRSTNAASDSGVFDTGLQFIDCFEDVVMFTELLVKAGGLFGNYSTFAKADFDLHFRSRNDHDRTQYWEQTKSQLLKQMHQSYLTLHKHIGRLIVQEKAFADQALQWTMQTRTDLQQIEKSGTLKPAKVDKQVRSILARPKKFHPIATLRKGTYSGVKYIAESLEHIDELKGYYNTLAHTTGSILEAHELQSLTDPKYWWKQFKPHFKRKSDIDTKALASQFSAVAQAGKVLESLAKSQQGLGSVLDSLENGVKGKSALSTKRELSSEVLEGWVNVLSQAVISLDKSKTRLEILKEVDDRRRHERISQ